MAKGFIVLAILCASSIGTSAAFSRTSDHVRPRLHFAHRDMAAVQNMAGMRAAVPERPTMFPSAWPRPYPYSFHETDGLSRNPNDCVVWGCIDNSN
jgi:hypothetical protein